MYVCSFFFYVSCDSEVGAGEIHPLQEHISPVWEEKKFSLLKKMRFYSNINPNNGRILFALIIILLISMVIPVQVLESSNIQPRFLDPKKWVSFIGQTYFANC